MKMKKVVPVVLAFALVASISVNAMAAGDKGKDKHEKTKAPAVTAPAAAVTAEEAKAAALTAAGVEEADLTRFSSEANKEVYKIEFAVDLVRYKYEISVLTGDVVKEEISRPRVDPNESSRITAAAAEDAALADAGLTRGDVKGIHSYMADYVSGIPSAYRVEFAVYSAADHHTTVYSYTIDILTGEVTASEIR